MAEPIALNTMRVPSSGTLTTLVSETGGTRRALQFSGLAKSASSLPDSRYVAAALRF